METALIPADFIACLCTDTDAVWEIDLDTLETIIWHDTTTPELVNTSIDLNKLLLSLQESNINIDYLYLSFNRATGLPIMVLHVPDISEVEACLTNKGFNSISEVH